MLVLIGVSVRVTPCGANSKPSLVCVAVVYYNADVLVPRMYSFRNSILAASAPTVSRTDAIKNIVNTAKDLRLRICLHPPLRFIHIQPLNFAILNVSVEITENNGHIHGIIKF